MKRREFIILLDHRHPLPATDDIELALSPYRRRVM
jgi:hypothetical protein